jgi:hypothetical protein
MEKEEQRLSKDGAVFARDATMPRKATTANAFEKREDDNEMNRI